MELTQDIENAAIFELDASQKNNHPTLKIDFNFEWWEEIEFWGGELDNGS